MEMGHFSSPKGSFNKKETKAIYYFLKTLYAKKYLAQAFQRNLYGISPGFLDPVTKLRLSHWNKEGSTKEEHIYLERQAYSWKKEKALLG